MADHPNRSKSGQFVVTVQPFRFRCEGCDAITDARISPENRKNRKFCTKECFDRNNPRHVVQRFAPFIQCENCQLLVGFGKAPSNYGKVSRFCSNACRSAIVQGPAHPRWKEGGRRKFTVVYQEWRLSVLRAQDFTCAFCGVRGGKLEVDHILPWATYEPFRLEPGNGRVVCKPCHRKHGPRPQRKTGVLHWM